MYADPADQKAYLRDHYRRNKSAYKLRAKAWNRKTIAANREAVRGYLAAHPCVDCGESDPVVLEFDHVRGEKIESVSEMWTKACTWKTVEKEIAKCDVRCANCHRRVTVKRRLDAKAVLGV